MVQTLPAAVRRWPAVLGAIALATAACSGDDAGRSDPAVGRTDLEGQAPRSADPARGPLRSLRPAAGRALRSGFSPGYEIVTADDAVLRRDLDGMAAAGGCWVRADFDWSRIERERGRYDWSSTDRIVREVDARGMQVLGLLAYTPAWARPPGTADKHPPLDPAAYARFAAAAVERYADRVRAWEVWNEPNITKFWQDPDPAAYAALLVEAATAMRRVDRDVHVVAAGLSPAVDDPETGSIAPTTFLRELLERGAGDHVDAVAMHPYSFPTPPTGDARGNNFAAVTPALRRVLVEQGRGDLLVWGTEFGVPTGTDPRAVDVDAQAAHLRAAYRQWERWDWTGPLLWYSWRDRGPDTGDVEDSFGLVEEDGTPKPAALDYDEFAPTADRERCQVNHGE